MDDLNVTEYREGGRRAIDRVLAPGFDDVDGLDTEQVRGRREEAVQVESDLSYARRLLQGRLDLLQAERERRAEGGPGAGMRTDAEIVADLTKALTSRDAGSPPRPSRALGESAGSVGRHMSTAPTVGGHRRDRDVAVGDPTASAAATLDIVELDALVDRLKTLERRVSADRGRVQRIADALAERLAQATSPPD